MPPDRHAGGQARKRRTASPPRVAEWRGFRVESEAGRIGVVAGVRRNAGSGEPTQLVVRAGRIGKSLLLIAVSDIDAVMPEARRLALRRGWTLLAAGASAATARP